MKAICTVSLLALGLSGATAYEPPPIPYAPAAGIEGSTAVAYNDARLSNWATAVSSVNFGEDVDDSTIWRDPAAALGPAAPGTPDVLVLGRGGSVVLEFAVPIADGDGDDFVVFENGFSETFLELAYVEVSSDGVHFVRFPNYSLTLDPVATWGVVSARSVHGLAGKYRAGFGTPFDLGTLVEAHEGALQGQAGFSDDFRHDLLGNFPFLDLESIRYVRLQDIPGDGNAFDCEGFAIYDPYPTFITAGFDLDAVGVINESGISPVSFGEWSAGFGLDAVADADTDGDRWPQYLEYLMGSRPDDPRDRPLWLVEVDASGSAVLTYELNRQAVGEAIPQRSNDGRQWTRVEPVEATVEGLQRRMRVVTGRDGGDTARMLRIIADGPQ